MAVAFGRPIVCPVLVGRAAHVAALHRAQEEAGSGRGQEVLLPELGARLPGLAPSPALGPEQERQRLFEALVVLFARLGARRPLLVVVEDVHWGDDSSLEWLGLLARRMGARVLLLALTYRGDEVHVALGHLLAELDRARLAGELPLAVLAAAEVDAMLRAIFHLTRPVRPDFLEALFALKEGNAFVVEETLKSLVAAGDTFYAEGRWRTSSTVMPYCCPAGSATIP